MPRTRDVYRAPLGVGRGQSSGLELAATLKETPWHSSMAKCRRLRKPARFDVAHRWLTKEAFIFAIELARALISHFECRAGGIKSFDEHLFSGRNQSELFLILKRTHGRQCTEMMVQG